MSLTDAGGSEPSSANSDRSSPAPFSDSSRVRKAIGEEEKVSLRWKDSRNRLRLWFNPSRRSLAGVLLSGEKQKSEGEEVSTVLGVGGAALALNTLSAMVASNSVKMIRGE